MEVEGKGVWEKGQRNGTGGRDGRQRKVERKECEKVEGNSRHEDRSVGKWKQGARKD